MCDNFKYFGYILNELRQKQIEFYEKFDFHKFYSFALFMGSLLTVTFTNFSFKHLNVPSY